MDVLADCRYRTERLDVGPWHEEVTHDELVAFVCDLLSPAVTATLPPEWGGPFDSSQATAWIGERDAESTVLLARARADRAPIGLLIVANDRSPADLRVGYLLTERWWGRGLATELAGGFVEWSRATRRVRSISGGVTLENVASAALLTRLGFEADGEPQHGEQVYRLTLPGTVTIRAETPADTEAIRRVVVAAFGSDTEGALVDRIRASPEFDPELALVAVIDGEIVGHVMISGAVLRGDQGVHPIAMLSPLAVAPALQRRGIGADLVVAALGVADDRGEPLVVLEGNPVYYSRFGFEHSLSHGLTLPLPGWAPSEAGQVKLLSAYDPHDARLRGQVVYPASFDGVDS